MKKLTTLALSATLLVTGVVNTGCWGSFQLTRKMWEFHDGIAGDDLGGRFIKTILYWIPGGLVYGIGGLVDALIFNTIEFWSGSNPIAMEAGEYEIQLVKNNGIDYKITATKNRFDVEQLNGNEKGEKVSLVFSDEDKSWTAITKNETTKVAQYVENVKTGELEVKVFQSNGSELVVPFSNEGLAQLEMFKTEENLAAK